MRCDKRFTHAFTACGCVFKEIKLVGSNQGNFLENATACSKRTLKTTVATQLNLREIKELGSKGWTLIIAYVLPIKNKVEKYICVDLLTVFYLT